MLKPVSKYKKDAKRALGLPDFIASMIRLTSYPLAV